MQIKIMSEGKSEIKATFFYFISNVCTRAFGFLTIPLYTHLLTTSEYGYLNTYSAWVSVLSVLLGLSLSGAIYGRVDLNKNERNRFQSSVFTLSIIAALFMSAIVVGIYILVNGKIDVIVILALIQGYGTFVVNFYLQELIVDNKYVTHSILSVMTVVIPVAITCIIISFLFKSTRYLCVIIPRVCVYGVLLLALAFLILKKGRHYLDKDIWKWSLNYCLPLVFHSLSLTILLQADRIMLSSLYSLSEAGIYSLIYNITLVLGVLIGALENTWKTWFFNSYEKMDRTIIQRRVRMFLTIAVLGIAIYVLIAPDIVRLFAAEEYHVGIYLIGPIALAYIFSFFYDFPVYLEYKKNATKYIAISSILAAIMNVVLNYFMIPICGGLGASLTTLISYVMMFVLHTLVSNKLEKGLFTFRLFIPFCLIGLLVLVIFMIVVNSYIVRYVLVFMLTFLFFAYLYINRDLLV